MAITKPPVLPAWADAGDKVQPSNAELSVGWPVSSTPPSRQRFNWALNFVANAVRYFSRRGLVDYDVAETYMIGDRVIGDDGKTYKCLVDNTIAFTPSTNPAKWARWGFTLAELNSEMTTPAQFDNTTKVATTAFVKQALGSKTFFTYAASTVLGAQHSGYEIWPAASSVAFSLPASGTVPLGTTIAFYGNGQVGFSVSRQGADTIVNGSLSGLTSVSIGAFDRANFMNAGGVWYLVDGEAHLGASSAFGASLGSNGYQKLPSGLIIQWGSGSLNYTTAIQTATITFPITFPNACRAVTVGNFGVLTSGTGYRLSVESFIAASFVAGYTAPLVASGTYSWIAIGN